MRESGRDDSIKKYIYHETDLGVLLHGDCMEILPRLTGVVDLVLTDPPYNANKDYGVYKDNLTENDYFSFMANIVRECRRVGVNQAWVAPRYKMLGWLQLLPEAHIVVVRRGARGPLRGGWSDQFETVLTIGKPSRCEVDLWDDIRLKGEGYFFREDTYNHPGYTPLPIMLRLVRLLSRHTVLEPFMGTGTTAVACERLGRRWTGIELNRKYCDIAVKRIEQERAQMKLNL